MCRVQLLLSGVGYLGASPSSSIRRRETKIHYAFCDRRWPENGLGNDPGLLWKLLSGGTAKAVRLSDPLHPFLPKPSPYFSCFAENPEVVFSRGLSSSAFIAEKKSAKY